MSRDMEIGSPSEAPDTKNILATDEGNEHVREILKEIKTAIGYGARIVTCPLFPMEIPGITAADALDANDCMGTVFTIKVPKYGIIYSATFYDLDDEGTQVDLEIFGRSIASAGNDAAFSPSDSEILRFITELAFAVFDDQVNSHTSELTNIGKAYSAPEGLFHIQAVTRSTPTIAAGNMPRVQLQILSGDPDFVEV